MPRKQHNIHYIYKTTCTVTNRYYIGMHSTSNIDDGYLGSGKRLRRSIRKYGKNNHSKEILEYCQSRAELVVRERELITEQHLSHELCMNLMSSGTGGFISAEHMKKCSAAGVKAYLNKVKTDLVFRAEYKERLKAIRINHITSGNHNFKTFLNKTHTDESKKLMSFANKNKGIGVENSQFGTCWVTKDGQDQKIKLTEISNYLETGWVRGRKK